ncbi:MAG: hypothetical protein V2B20_16720 [Pseudomonadota bacterium]
MKRRLIVFAVLTLFVLSLQGLAQTQPGQGGTMKMGNAIMLEEVTEAGVKAMVHLIDVSAAMEKMGKKENFHFMVMFSDVATGAAISNGSVALKITGPGQEKAGEPIALMAMDGSFGANIDLTAKGLYNLEVGSKLADGTKRQFKFQFTVQ